MSFSIEDEALPGEVYITQFLVRPDCPAMATREIAEAAMKKQYPHHNLRFYYGYLQYKQERVSSAEYAKRFMYDVTAAITQFSFGGAVFGTPIPHKSTRRGDVASDFFGPTKLNGIQCNLPER